MRKGVKTYLTVCGCLIVAGAIFTAVGTLMGGKVFGVGFGADGLWVNTPRVHGSADALSYVEETRELEAFDSMDISIDAGDFTIEQSDHYGIEYCIDSRYDMTVAVEDGCLKIVEKYPHNYTNYYGVRWMLWGMDGVLLDETMDVKKEYVKLYVPADADFDSVKLYNDLGSIVCGDLSADTLWIDADYGDVTLGTIRGVSADITLGAGKLKLPGFSGGDFTLVNEYGNVSMQNVNAKALAIKMESGSLTVMDAQADSLQVKQEYGSVRLENVVIKGALGIVNESGNTALTEVDCADMQIQSDYGDVDGVQLRMGTGRFVLESGSCDIEDLDFQDMEISSDYGSVYATLADQLAAYSFCLEAECGQISLDGTDTGDEARVISGQGDKKLNIYSESGDIRVRQN